MKRVAILGSTGSIGINTLKVIERFPKKFKVVGLSAYNNFKLLEKQIRQFSPTHVAVSSSGVGYLKKNWNRKSVRILDVESELTRIVELASVDIVVLGMRGSAALIPFLQAVRAGKTVAPANKEALVVAGDLLMSEAKRSQAQIIPVDSEQSAIFQCLNGENRDEVKTVHLTASGGALHKVPQTRFARLSVEQILKHPRWKMGKKITVDSATLMNKGFEVIEAQRLFGLKMDQIKVLVHPEAIIHSMVEFRDGSVLAQLGITDMRLPIQYALTYPERLDSNLPKMNFYQLKQLTFMKPDFQKFPSLKLAFDVARQGGSLPAVLNAADEEAVDAFLNQKINFSKIYPIVEKVIARHRLIAKPSLAQILAADQWAREESRRILKL